jgi:putative DNA primase/helicase
MTASKAALQDLALDSTSRFYRELISGDIDGVRPGTAALGTDVFDLYRTWCHRIGVKPAPMPRLLNALEKKHGIDTARKRYLDGQTVKGPHGVCYIPRWDSEARRVLIQPEKPVSESDNTWHGACITAFRNAVKDYKGAANG